MPGHAVDRNLLFGILALQMDLITRDGLIAAMGAWALAKHRPIGEILVQAGALDPVDRADLEPMIDRRIAREGNDPAKSLAALSSVAGLAADLRRSIGDPEALQSLARVPGGDPYATRATAPPPWPASGVRFRKVRDHARGGLGVVFVARDAELNREVALKEIQDRHADNPSSRARFLIEAEITGGLEHPGIVPVYGLGSYDDGRPFYAMRFIRGDSLKDAIAAFHADEALKADPGARTLGLQKLLRRFLDVCNAVEYAHSRGVLHRDLKPDNVMVGRYGETLVVDWGLAKSVGRPEGDWPEAALSASSSGGSAETIPGSVVGTPAYMSPEQAEGRFDLLGPASDVYSLGATLYALLAGRPPLTGKPLDEVLADVRRGSFPRPREFARWLDPALESVCLKAMALKPVDRYPSPSDLARDVERWIADEAVAAHPEPLARRARRWARKHRTVVATASASAAVAAAILGGVAWAAIARQRRADAVGLATLEAAGRLEIEARATADLGRWSGAVAEARRALSEIESGGGTASARARAMASLAALQAEEGRRREEIRGEGRDREVVADLDEARLQGSNVKDDRFDFEAKNAAFADAFRSSGIDIASLPIGEAAARVRSSRIAGPLVAALDEWAGHPTGVPPDRLDAIRRAADPGPEATAIRDAVARKDADGLRRLVGTPGERRRLGEKARVVVKGLADLDLASSLPLLEALRRERPSDFWLNFELARAYRNAISRQIDPAIRYYTAAAALRPMSPGVHNSLGIALHDKGLLGAAVEAYRRAVRLQPDYARAYSNLGNALYDKGQLDASVDACRAAIRLRPDYDLAYNNLGNALGDKGQFDAAVEAYRRAIRLRPVNPKAYFNMAETLRDKGQLEARRAAARLRPDDALALCELGLDLKRLGLFREALENLERGHELGTRDPGWRHRSAQWVRACRRLVESESRLPALLEDEASPGDPEAGLALADFYFDRRHYAASARAYGEAIAARPAPGDDPRVGLRRDAARAASRAGSGLGKDQPPPDDPTRLKLRDRARAWLRADLAAWSGVLDGGAPEAIREVAPTLEGWKLDADLAGIRDAAALAGWPDAEREQSRSLWADVEALRLRAVAATR